MQRRIQWQRDSRRNHFAAGWWRHNERKIRRSRQNGKKKLVEEDAARRGWICLTGWCSLMKRKEKSLVEYFWVDRFPRRHFRPNFPRTKNKSKALLAVSVPDRCFLSRPTSLSSLPASNQTIGSYFFDVSSTSFHRSLSFQPFVVLLRDSCSCSFSSCYSCFAFFPFFFLLSAMVYRFAGFCH